MLDVAAVRRDIPFLDRAVYLNTGGVAPLPRPVYDCLSREFTDRFLSGPPLNMRPQSLKAEKDGARQEMARFLGVMAQEICFTRGVSDGANIVFGGLPWEPGDEVIITDEEHSAFLLPALLAKERFGAVVRIVRLDNDPVVILQRFEALLSQRTRLVALSHVTTDNGIRLPVEGISASARRASIPVYLDGAQAIGQFPVDLGEVGCDFYSLLSYKWLLGPYSAGVLYISEAWAEKLQVTSVGARAERAIDVEAGTFDLLPGAQGFEFGPRTWPCCFAMVEAVHYLERIGPCEIAGQAGAQAAYLRQGLEAIPGVILRSPADTETATGIVTFSIEGMPGREISDAFRNRWNIITRPTGLRFDGVRVSVAFFTTRDELDTVLEATDQLARSAT